MEIPSFLKKFPWATLALCALVLASYLYFGTEPYASSAAISAFGLASWNPVGVVTSLFMHQGVRHLLANLIPLAVFAFLLETTLTGGAVIVIFLASGIAGGLVYVLLNPGALIIGASAAIAGLMAAAVALKPKQAIALALLVALLAVLVVTPASEYFAGARKTQVQSDVDSLTQQNAVAQAQSEAAQAAVDETGARVPALQQAGKLAEAEAARAQLEREKAAADAAAAREKQANASLAVAQVKAEEFAQGEAHAEAPATILPHAVGALVGLALVFAFRKQDVDDNLRGLKAWLGRLRGKNDGAA